jgi:hypothetical protein
MPAASEWPPSQRLTFFALAKQLTEVRRLIAEYLATSRNGQALTFVKVALPDWLVAERLNGAPYSGEYLCLATIST